MDFKDFLAYLKTIPLPVAYQEVIDSLKPYGSVIISFERTLGQPGDSLVLSDPEALGLVYQFVYWALCRDAVDINVPLIEASIGPMLSMDIMISNVGCEQLYTKEALEITRMDWATLFIHLREYCGVTLTDDINRFVYDEDALHGKETSFVNCNVLFERTDE
jgi:hypothetical protein